MHNARFETDSRYYKVYLQKDLLDDWVVTCAFVGKDSNRGQIKHFPYESLDAAIEKFKDIIKVRNRRGYRIIECSLNTDSKTGNM